MLNETSQDGRQQKTIDRYEFEIFDTRFPPKIPDGAWMDDPRNERWAWARKKDEPAQSQAQSSPTTDPNTMFKTVFEAVRQLRPETPKDDSASITKAVIEAMKTGNQQAWEMFKSQAQTNDPTSMLKMVEAILAVVKPEKATSDPMITLLMQELKSSRDAAAAAAKQNTDILLAMLNKKEEASGKSPMESLKEMAEGFAVIKEAFGGDSSPVKTGVLDIIKEVLSPLAGAFAPVLGALAMGAMNKSRAPQPQGPPPQYQPQAGQPQLQAAPPQQQTNGAPQPEVIDPQLQGFIGLSQQVAHAISMGLAGDVFAEAFERQHGAAMYDQIVSTPLDGLLQAMQSVPQVWGILQPFEAKLPIFIAQFYDYAKDEPEIEEEPQAPEAVPPSKKPGRKKGAAIQ